MPYANNKGADQPARLRSLISAFVVNAFVVRCLDSIISLSFYIRNFKPLLSFCGCAGRFESTLVANPDDRFSRDMAHFWDADSNAGANILVTAIALPYFPEDQQSCNAHLPPRSGQGERFCTFSQFQTCI